MSGHQDFAPIYPINTAGQLEGEYQGAEPALRQARGDGGAEQEGGSPSTTRLESLGGSSMGGGVDDLARAGSGLTLKVNNKVTPADTRPSPEGRGSDPGKGRSPDTPGLPHRSALKKKSKRWPGGLEADFAQTAPSTPMGPMTPRTRGRLGSATDKIKKISRALSLMAAGGGEEENSRKQRQSQGFAKPGNITRAISRLNILSRRATSTDGDREVEVEAKQSSVRPIMAGSKNWNDIRLEGRGERAEDSIAKTLENITSSLAMQYTTQCAFLLTDPRKPRRLVWDAILLVAVCISAFFIPYDVGFLDVRDNARLYVNLAFDAIFIVDVMINFTTMYRDEKKGWISNLRWIGKRYIKGPFLPDLISVLPYDLLALQYWQGKEHLRWTRALRLLKLLRLARGPRVLVRLEDYLFRLNYGIMTIAQFIVITVLLSHWLGCLWALIPKCEGKKEAWTDALLDPWTTIEDVPTRTLYANSVYFAVYSITSTGFGDVVPVTNLERYYSVVIMLMGGYFFGYVTGSLTSIIGERNARKTEFRKHMDELNRFMDDHDLPRELRAKLRDFLRYRASSSHQNYSKVVVDSLSQQLRAEVVTHTSCAWVNNVDFFQNCPQQFYVELSIAMQAETFSPQEEVIKVGDAPSKMFIMQKGVVASQGMVYTRGLVFGTDMLNVKSSLGAQNFENRNYFAVALTFADVLVLEKRHIDPILDAFPHVKEMLRRAVVKRIFRYEVRAYARAVMRVLTGERSHLSALHGDPDGREEHYYLKLSKIYDREQGVELFKKMRAAQVIQRRVKQRWLVVRKKVLPKGKPRKFYGRSVDPANIGQVEDLAIAVEHRLDFMHDEFIGRVTELTSGMARMVASRESAGAPGAVRAAAQGAADAAVAREEMLRVQETQRRHEVMLEAILSELQGLKRGSPRPLANPPRPPITLDGAYARPAPGRGGGVGGGLETSPKEVVNGSTWEGRSDGADSVVGGMPRGHDGSPGSRSGGTDGSAGDAAGEGTSRAWSGTPVQEAPPEET